MVTGDLLSRARAGDGEAFRELAESHRRELQMHCYRLLGSFADAEDAVQETMLAAWQGIGGFTEERASLRTWLYKIATNRCLNARRAASRRPAREWDMSRFEPPVPTPRDEPVWLQPFPDALLEGAVDRLLGPEARYEQTEAISLAFVTALQLLPPRQVAVLILRDVLGFHASEVAEMLEVTVESVNSALKRARASLQRRQQPAAGRQPPPAAGSPAEDVIVARFARAWESADLDALVALLSDDVFIAMPPEPFGYEGRDLVARYWARQFGAGRRFDLVPTRANGQPAFGAYLRVPAGIRHATGFYVLTLAGNRICAMTRFDNSVLPWFGLPRSQATHPAGSAQRTLQGGCHPVGEDDADAPQLSLKGSSDPCIGTGHQNRRPRPAADAVPELRQRGGALLAITPRPPDNGGEVTSHSTRLFGKHAQDRGNERSQHIAIRTNGLQDAHIPERLRADLH